MVEAVDRVTSHQVPILTITISSDKDGVPFEPVTLEIPVRAAWQIIESIAILGMERAAQLLGMGALLHPLNPKPGSALTPRESTLILALVATLDRELLGGPWESHEDRVLAFAYSVLQQKEMQWDAAAHFVTRALNKPITAGALRKRLERWAPDQGLPKVEKYKPRQTKVTR